MQLCTNSEGSFSCSCAPGYHLTESGDCKAIGEYRLLLYVGCMLWVGLHVVNRAGVVGGGCRWVGLHGG